jgi:hypothetical protein
MTGTPLPNVNEHARIVHRCVMSGGPVSVSEAHIIDRKLVLTAKKRADRLRPQITQLDHFLNVGHPADCRGGPIFGLHDAC